MWGHFSVGFSKFVVSKVAPPLSLPSHRQDVEGVPPSLLDGRSGLLPMATQPLNQETLPQMPSAMAKAKHSENQFCSKQFPGVQSSVASSDLAKGKSTVLSSITVSIGSGTSSIKNQAPQDLCPKRHSHSRGKSKPPQIHTSASEDATHPF
ncbi:uncharacterized protein J3R85_006104 [Psidium guajava]|nr:uncharacterized protein J3R85_006104 [Psidium guajava]